MYRFNEGLGIIDDKYHLRLKNSNLNSHVGSLLGILLRDTNV